MINEGLITIMLIRNITPMLFLKIYKKQKQNKRKKNSAILKNKMAASLNVLLTV